MMAKREAGASAGAKARGKPKKLGAEIVDLAKRKKNGAAVPDGSNTGAPVPGLIIVGAKDEQAFVIMEGKIKRQWNVVKKAKDVVKSETGSLNSLYGEAKESGIPAQRISALKKRLKLEDRPIEDVVAEHQEIAWQVSVVKGSKLRQLGLFEVVEPSTEGYEMLGEKAGYEGGHIDNAPGKPGDEKHTAYVTGFKRGQKRLAEETFNSGEKVAGNGEGEEALDA
jgi:hypothetical protein